MTHTYAILDVPRTVYAAVRALLSAADYEHTFHSGADGEVIDMHGIALRANPRGPSPQGDGDPGVVDHSAFIEQLEAWMLDLERVLRDAQNVLLLNDVLLQMRQVAGDLRREDEAAR